MNKKSDLTPDQIKAAEQAGIISKTQAEAMRAKFSPKGLDHLEDAALIGNEDDMRFVRSFSDVFIAIGIGLLVFGLYGFCTLRGGGVAYLIGAVVLWMMAEYFGKKKRAHLPTLLIALAYLAFAFNGFKDVLNSTGRIDAFPAVVTLAAMLLFYWRFKLPFSIALIAISLLILAYSFVGGSVSLGTFLLCSGIILFVVALFYDARDTARLTRFADNAFWLHFTAAPLIIHGVASKVLSITTTNIMGLLPMAQLDKSDAMVLLTVIIALALMGLAINRRALIVSSLGYAGFALVMLLKGDGLELATLGSVIAMTLLLLGGAIVFLGVGWHGARRVLLTVLPTSGVFGKIFPPVPD